MCFPKGYPIFLLYVYAIRRSSFFLYISQFILIVANFLVRLQNIFTRKADTEKKTNIWDVMAWKTLNSLEKHSTLRLFIILFGYRFLYDLDSLNYDVVRLWCCVLHWWRQPNLSLASWWPFPRTVCCLPHCLVPLPAPPPLPPPTSLGDFWRLFLPSSPIMSSFFRYDG